MPQNMNLITRNANDGALNASKKPASRKWLQDTRRETSTDIQRAARFYYLQKNCVGAKLEGQSFGTATTTPPGLNLLRLEETLSAANLRLAATFVERLDWKACIDWYDRAHTLFYLNPPYWETEGYGVPFEYAEYVVPADRLRTRKIRAIASLNDHPDYPEGNRPHSSVLAFQVSRIAGSNSQDLRERDTGRFERDGRLPADRAARE